MCLLVANDGKIKRKTTSSSTCNESIMDDIVEVLVRAGYFRAQIKTLPEFDKIIGGFAWAMQAFSTEFDIDIFYTDALDLGQKISLTERLVMVLMALKCPHRIEPHQIVGLDYSSLLPVVKWLVKRSGEVRQEHEAFNRLLALRYYFRVLNLDDNSTRSYYIVPISKLKGLHKLIDKESDHLTDKQIEDQFHLNQQEAPLASDTKQLARKLLDSELQEHKLVSFTNLPLIVDSSKQAFCAKTRSDPTTSSSIDHLDEDDDSSGDDSRTTVVEKVEVESSEAQRCDVSDSHSRKPIADDEDHRRQEQSDKVIALNKELDTELMATNQKILSLIKKLDQMPSSMEILQYQRRYIELCQQLVSKNKDVKKLYALYNSLDSTKYYLIKEIKLLDSIADNLELTIDSISNRDDFVMQLQEIIRRIEAVRAEVLTKLDLLRAKCDALNKECASNDDNDD